MNELSLDHLTILDAAPAQLIEAAAAGGFDAVGLRIVAPQPSDTIAPVIGQREVLRELKARMASTGVKIGLIEAIWLAPETGIAKLESALATGADLGAEFVLVVGNDPDEGRTIANLSRVAEVANTYGLQIAFEFMSYICVRNFDQAVGVVQAARQPNVRLLIDALHLSRSGQHPRTLGKLDSAVVSYVHLCDADADVPPIEKLREEGRYGRYGRYYPGEGGLWLDDFLDAMPSGVPIGIEAPCRAYAQLPPVERGRLAGKATRGFLERYYEAKSRDTPGRMAVRSLPIRCRK